MENRSNQILVGSVVLGLIALLVFFTVWLIRIGDGSDNSYDIYFAQSVESSQNIVGANLLEILF